MSASLNQAESQRAHPKFVIVYIVDGGASSITFHVSGENTPFDHVNYVPGQSPGPCICRVSRTTVPLLYIYIHIYERLPPGLASPLMYNQFTVHRSAATISDNYRERN